MQAIESTTTPSHSFRAAAGGFSERESVSIMNKHIVQTGNIVKCYFPIVRFVTLFSLALISPSYADANLLAKAKVEPIPDAMWTAMQGKSYHVDIKGCAQRADLVLLTVPYWNYKGEAKIGELIVNKAVGKDVLSIFNTLYTDKYYAFERVELIDKYGGDDRASMTVNNTSAYNCRTVSGTTRLSSHAKGLAIDINPFTNPFVTKDFTSPPGAEDYDTPAERAALKDKPGMILRKGALVKAFASKGWKWGGDWKSIKDYQHFSRDGK
jgi:D-alanyl-D-alanine carboxypeptidase